MTLYAKKSPLPHDGYAEAYVLLLYGTDPSSTSRRWNLPTFIGGNGMASSSFNMHP